MGLPLKQFIRTGFGLAKQLAPDAFEKDCTIRLGPTTTVDPVTDEATTVWAVEVTADLFGFDDSDERDIAGQALPMDTRLRTFLMEAADFPPGAEFRQNGTIEASGLTWNVYRAEVAPGGGMAIFYCRA